MKSNFQSTYSNTFFLKHVTNKFIANQIYDLTKIFETTETFTYNPVYATYNNVVYSLH